jgi:DNA-binding CsgD family transcriptional regulator/tetratricopeptide (TPR) repeat protein
MSVFRRLVARAARPAPLRVKSGDAFAACGEKYGVTAREGEIIRLLLEGKSNKRITEELFISDHTVKNHIHHIYQKLGINNRVQLVQCYRAALEEAGRVPAGAPAAEGAAPTAEARSPGLRMAAFTAVLALLVFAAVLAAWRPWGRRPGPVARPPMPALAVLDFENLSGDPELEKWVTGLPLLLTTDLLQSKHIRTLSDDAVFGALRKYGLTERKRYSREELRRLAKELRADYLLTGSLMKAGGRIVITAFLQDARTGAPIRTEKIESADEQGLMRGADGLARLIKSNLNLTAVQAQDDIEIDVEVLTTSSALAYKYYSEGRRYHRTGDYEQSLLMLRKAVELDPEFALAYRLMSVDARNLGYFQREAQYMRRAFELSERLPENCRERHLIRGDYYSSSEATAGPAVGEFKKVLENHPYDLVANNNLGILSYELEDYEAAVSYADIPIRQGADNPFPYYTKAVSLVALGRPEEALRLLAAYHEDHPANRLIYQTLVGIMIETNDFAGAGAVLDRAVAVFPDPSWAYWKGAVLYETQGSTAAQEEFRQLFLLDEASWRLRAHMRLANTALADGRFEQAEDACRSGSDLAEVLAEHEWASDFHCLSGRILLEQGKVDAALLEAQKAVDMARASSGNDRLRAALSIQALACLKSKDLATVESLNRQFHSLTEAGTNKRTAREYDLFQGILELERGHGQAAVEFIERAVSSLPPGNPPDSRKLFYYFSLAAARENEGDFAGAAAAYETVAVSTGHRLYLGEDFSLAVLGLARMEERLGRPARALEGYRSFLAQWKDADPGRPEITEALGRVDALSAASARGR